MESVFYDSNLLKYFWNVSTKHSTNPHKCRGRIILTVKVGDLDHISNEWSTFDWISWFEPTNQSNSNSRPNPNPFASNPPTKASRIIASKFGIHFPRPKSIKVRSSKFKVIPKNTPGCQLSKPLDIWKCGGRRRRRKTQLVVPLKAKTRISLFHNLLTFREAHSVLRH